MPGRDLTFQVLSKLWKAVYVKRNIQNHESHQPALSGEVKCFSRICKFEEEKSAYLSQALFQLFNYKILQLLSFFWPLKGEWIAKFVLWGICIVGNYYHSYHNFRV